MALHINATAPLDLPQDWDVPEQIGLWTDVWRRFRRNRLAVAGLVLVAVLVLDALLVPVLTAVGIVQDPIKQNVVIALIPPNAQHLMGTDILGRDTLSRVMFGARI